MNDDTTTNEPAGDADVLTVFAIRSLPGGLRVEMVAATEMSFELELRPADDYDQTITDLCAIAPILMRLDADIMEMYDGADERPARADLLRVNAFVTKYRSRIRNANVAIGAFERL